MATLQGFIDEVIAEVANVNGIRQAPNDPPEKISAWPIAVVYSTSGVAKNAPAQTMTTLDDVTIAVLVPLVDMARKVALLLPFRESVPMAINSKLMSTGYTNAQTFGDITHTFGPVDWAGMECFGWLFTIKSVKIQTVIT